MRKVRVEDAVGLQLAHDITEIVPGKKKDAIFLRGRTIQTADIEKLRDLGKNHIFVIDGPETEVHEEEASRRLGLSVVNESLELRAAKEGRTNILSRIDGLAIVNKKHLDEMNKVKDILFTTLPDRYPVKAGDVVAATRIVPLYVSEQLLRAAEAVGRKGIITVQPFRKMKVGLVVTGTEVATGRIPDASERVEEKLKGYGCAVLGRRLVVDDIALIRDAVRAFLVDGADLVVTTGGLSVDPDDLTKEGIEATGARVISYGAPVFPGAMFLVAQLNGKYILGAPACVYFNTHTMLDILVPRIMAGEKISAATVRKMGHGGLCLHCDVCRYPNCFFGKGH